MARHMRAAPTVSARFSKLRRTGPRRCSIPSRAETTAPIQPRAVIADASGNFYGTTYGGGTSDLGTVFELAANGTESVLYSFAGGSDGDYPFASLILDAKGNLYGTTCPGRQRQLRHGLQGRAGRHRDGALCFRRRERRHEPRYQHDRGQERQSVRHHHVRRQHRRIAAAMVAAPSSNLRLTAPKPSSTLSQAATAPNPCASLLAGKKGELISTTYNGGNTGCGGTGCGVIYKIRK